MTADKLDYTHGKRNITIFLRAPSSIKRAKLARLKQRRITRLRFTKMSVHNFIERPGALTELVSQIRSGSDKMCGNFDWRLRRGARKMRVLACRKCIFYCNCTTAQVYLNLL